MKRLIFIFAVIITSAVIPVAVFAATNLHVVYNKGGIKCADRLDGSLRTIACAKAGGYMVGISKYVVMVMNSKGETVFIKAQP